MKKTKRTPGKFLATPLALFSNSKPLFTGMQYPARRPTGIESLSGERKQNKFEQISLSKTYLKARAVSVKYNQSRISTQDKLKSINDDKQKKKTGTFG